MFLAVVANPIPARNFNGKVCNIRVSRTERYKKLTCNQNFTDMAGTNADLRAGKWIELAEDNMTFGMLKFRIGVNFDLDDDIVERLALRSYGPPNANGKQKTKYLRDDTALLPDLSLGGYTLVAMYQGGKEGDTREVDVNCDSSWMTETMPKVGEAIRKAYHWVDKDTLIYLYLDNAGGHGTKEAVDAYVKYLADEWNVICIHQRPRSPATNMLDLGVWMAFQSVVEKAHHRHRKEKEALCRTVEKAWEDLDPIKLTNVYNRWKMVLDLIIEDNGGDALVESKRGKLFHVPSEEAEDLDEGDAAPDESGEVMLSADEIAALEHSAVSDPE